MSDLEKTKAQFRIFIEGVKKAVVVAVSTAVPFLRLPVINFVFEWTVSWVIRKIVPFLEIWIVDHIIEVEVNAQKVAFEKARDELKAILAKQVKDPKEIQNASDEFDSKLSDLIKLKPKRV